jgi:hypothetical protein
MTHLETKVILLERKKEHCLNHCSRTCVSFFSLHLRTHCEPIVKILFDHTEALLYPWRWDSEIQRYVILPERHIKTPYVTNNTCNYTVKLVMYWDRPF